jgi:Tol biopolymer transport system component
MRRYLLLLCLLCCALVAAIPSAADVTERVSVSSAGIEGNGSSDDPAVSVDGRYVAFRSEANNLVPGDANGCRDIFVRDRMLGTTEVVSVSSAGAQGDADSACPSISADGRYIAFQSDAADLVEGDTNGVWDVFVHDRLTGETDRVSISSAGTEGNGNSYDPSISADGRYVAFPSCASNLVESDTNGSPDVFVHDRQTGGTERVSVTSAGAQAQGCSGWPSVSADGGCVGFYSHSANLVEGDTNGVADVFVHDRLSGTIERVSANSVEVEGNDCSPCYPSVSLDGRYVAFDSRATNLVEADNNGTWDVFMRDRLTGDTERVSVSSAGMEGNNWSQYRAISADGRSVAFESGAWNLVEGDTNGAWDIFLRDREAGTTKRVSVSSAGAEANDRSHWPSISADGSCVAFDSWASNLVPDDTNGLWDVFVHVQIGQTTVGLYDATTGTFRLINSNATASVSDLKFRFGPAPTSWKPITGDWDYDEVSTIGLYDPAAGTFRLINSNATASVSDLKFRFGPAPCSWKAIAGDWDGDGVETVGLYDAATGTFRLINGNATHSVADLKFVFSSTSSNWLPIAGDWDGDGVVTVGLYSPTTGYFHLRNTNSAGPADLSFRFGPAPCNWLPIAGDWDGDGDDTVGLYDAVTGTFRLINNNAASATSDLKFRFGPAPCTWLPIAGDWDGM